MRNLGIPGGHWLRHARARLISAEGIALRNSAGTSSGASTQAAQACILVSQLLTQTHTETPICILKSSKQTSAVNRPSKGPCDYLRNEFQRQSFEKAVAEGLSEEARVAELLFSSSALPLLAAVPARAGQRLACLRHVEEPVASRQRAPQRAAVGLGQWVTGL